MDLQGEYLWSDFRTPFCPAAIRIWTRPQVTMWLGLLTGRGIYVTRDRSGTISTTIIGFLHRAEWCLYPIKTSVGMLMQNGNRETKPKEKRSTKMMVTIPANFVSKKVKHSPKIFVDIATDATNPWQEPILSSSSSSVSSTEKGVPSCSA